MCGISGILDTGRRTGNRDLQGTVLGMVNALRHRGPDDVGTWADDEAGIALGHRRLAILDLSAEGHQPMRSACGRYVISFNGEIYNFRALRQELEGLGHRFRGHSDTEVMLAGIVQWGLVCALEQFNGMFAFALWDRLEQRLHLSRDRMGEKPLYYGWLGRTLVFGSELKALRAHPAFDRPINRQALTLFLRHGYIPAPHSVYEGIVKVPTASVVTFDRCEAGAAPSLVPYWSLAQAANRGLAEPFLGSEEEAIAQLDSLLQDAVKMRMESDVPLGAFLSGGVDSSTTVALMQTQSSRPVQTFTVGFHEAAYNEAHEAKKVAQHLGTAHTEFYVTPGEAMAVIPKLPTLYDEPFSDPSQVPTYLISELARRDVTVTLSGDGGDELFAGYDRYLMGMRVWNRLDSIPLVVRRLAAGGLRLMPESVWQPALRSLTPILPERIRRRNPANKLRRIEDLLLLDSPQALYLDLVSHWKTPSALVLEASEPPTSLSHAAGWPSLPAFPHSMLYLDMMTYLPDDILVKVDRASMGVSLEARVPFLDHRVVEFSWRIPLSMKIRNGKGKWLLRKLLYNYVPQPLVDRPKMGFGVPFDAWLRGPLREWAENLLDEKKLGDRGLLNSDPIRATWNEHLSGTANREFPLWNVLMFQAWLEHERSIG